MRPKPSDNSDLERGAERGMGSDAAAMLYRSDENAGD